jgi:cytochrome P450
MNFNPDRTASIPAPSGAPRLADIVVSEKELSTTKFVRAMGCDYLGAFDRRAFHDLIVERRDLWFKTFLISDPNGIRRVLVENPSNYPKAGFTNAILKPVLGSGLLTADDDLWRKHRKVMAPLFDPRLVPKFACTIAKAVQDRLDQWGRRWDGTEMDICAEMMNLTLQIISQTMFSQDSGELGELISRTSTSYHPHMTFSIWGTIPVFRNVWAGLRNSHAQKMLQTLNQAIYELIAQREKLPVNERSNDLLDHLLDAQRMKTGGFETLAEIRDEVMTIFVAGHETTALALTWIMYVLSQHPCEQERVVREIRDVLGDRAPTFDDINDMSYTRMVINEVLRLYPPIHTLGWREAVDADEICGRRVPKGAFITIVPWVVHRHTKLWDRPAEFLPTRFSESQQSARPRYSYIPFSTGPHVCIGASFAIMEILFVLSILLRRYQLFLANGYSVKPKGMVTLHPSGGLKMYLQKRAV